MVAAKLYEGGEQTQPAMDRGCVLGVEIYRGAGVRPELPLG